MSKKEYDEVLTSGETLFEKGDFKEAAEIFSALLGEQEKRAGSETDDELTLHYLRGLCYRYLHRNGEALSDLRRALALSPDNPLILLEYGYICSLTGRDAEAEQSLLPIADLCADDYEEESREQVEVLSVKARAYLACLYTDQGRTDEAGALLKDYDY